MCVFCAAIPAAAAMGAKANAKQKKAIVQAKIEGKSPPRKIIPARTATLVAVTGLAVCSVVYHTHLGV